MGKRGPKPRRLKSLSEPRAPDEFEPIRRLAFVNAYIANGGRGGEAAKAAGYAEASAHVRASELLKEPDIKLAIAERIQLALDAAKVDDQGLTLIREAAYIAFADPAEALDEDGTVRTLREMPPHFRRAIAGFDVDHVGESVIRTKVKLSDKKGSLEFLAKMKKLLKEQVEVSMADEMLKAIANLP